MSLPTAVVELLADLEAVVVVELALDGRVRRANRGFHRLVEPSRAPETAGRNADTPSGGPAGESSEAELLGLELPGPELPGPELPGPELPGPELLGPGARWCLQPSFADLLVRAADQQASDDAGLTDTGLTDAGRADAGQIDAARDDPHVAAHGEGGLQDLARPEPPPADTTVVYHGLLTVGDPDGPGHTLRASVRRHADGWLLTGELDVEGMERLSRQVLELNKDLAERQRELARAHRLLGVREEEFERLSLTDELTGLANRRRFMQRLSEEVAHCTRSGDALSLALMDLDDFKGINDRFGHPAGDQVLQATAQQLRQAIRAYDVAARLGGDEFALLLVGSDMSAARVVCERVREGLAALAGLPGEIQAHASVGIAELARRGRSDADAASKDLLERADRTLYRAKDAGGDRVETERVETDRLETDRFEADRFEADRFEADQLDPEE